MMRIPNNYPQGLELKTESGKSANPRDAEKGIEPPKTGAGLAPTADNIRVMVSNQALELARAAENGVDAEKVARLKSAIQSNSFTVDAQAIAKALVEGK